MEKLDNRSKIECRNEILKALPPEEMILLRPLLTLIRLVNGQELYEPGARIEHVFFFEHGFASIVAEVDDSAGSVEVGLTGRESIAGVSALLGPAVTNFNRVMVQMPGSAYRMTAEAMRESAEGMPVLRLLLLQGLERLMAQVSQTAACNSKHALPQRLARWLLMAHDRADSDELPLTQEFLSMMLTVRRPGVTVAMGTLQAAGLVSHTRGRVHIRDRPGLEGAACDCYGRVKAFGASLEAREL